LDRLVRHYGALAMREIPAERGALEPRQQLERRASFPKEVAADRLLMGWHGCGLAHRDHAALEVAVELLAGSFSSRIYRALVIERQLCSEVSMDVPRFRDAGLLELATNLT